MTTDLQRFGHWQLNGILRSCLITAVVAISMLFCIALAMVVAFLIPLPQAWDDWRGLIGFITGTLLNVFLALVTMVIVVVLRRKKLNTIFSVFNPKFKTSFLGQRYQTEVMVDGITMNVLLQQGPMLTISTPIETRVRATYGNKVFGQELTWEQLQHSSSDPNWITQFAEASPTRQAIITALTLQSAYEVRSLTILPNMIMLRLYRFPLTTLTSDMARQLLQSFVAVVQAAQSTPTTSQPMVDSKLERLNDIAIHQPYKIMIWVFVGVGLILFLSAMMVALLVVAAVVLSQL